MLNQMAAATAKKIAEDNNRARAAEPFEQRQQQEAPAGGAQQIEEVDPVDALDGFGNGQRDDVPGDEEGQRRGEVDQGQVPVA